jgi:hypothetical protein
VFGGDEALLGFGGRGRVCADRVFAVCCGHAVLPR